MERYEYLNLYTGNHGKRDGIEDYITLISKLMEERGIPVKVSERLDPHAVNLIIDEFSNYAENHRLDTFKENYPDSKIVFVLTEFVERKWGVESFNHFGGLFDAAAIALFDVYLRMVRNDFHPVDSLAILKLLCFLPLLAAQAMLNSMQFIFGRLVAKPIASPIAKYLQKYHRTIYFHMRYLGLKANVHYADALMTSHEKIIDGYTKNVGVDSKLLRYFGVLYPEFDERDILSNLMKDKKLFIEITGTVSHYRQSWVERINRRLIYLGMHNVFGYCMSFPFSLLESGEPIERGAYSLHPPQTKTWPYCSPTRIFRALSVDHNIPVLTLHFNQNPIEDVCYILKDEKSIIELYEMYSDPKQQKNFIEPKIKAYNTIAIARNNILAKHLNNLMSGRE